ncbi:MULTISPECIES: hypothetical protein [unclassified Bradyrhizobium]|uniref:hypothetical protein n=1 Tax=unclassified Bradyrhizobium TaxID=2631580 RepID=UPI0028EFAF69|nr:MULTISPECIES: hypothetical protein [unclassified Bradyrhizobium]
MVTDPTRKVPRKTKRRRKRPEEFVDYIVEIESWDFRYWLALNTVRNQIDPYHEHRHVEMKGRLLRPLGLQTDRVEVSLFLSMSLMEERRKEFKPIAVGAIESYLDRLDAGIGIPSDALEPILEVLIAGRPNFLVMRGSKLRERSARLHSYSLGTKLEEDDLAQLDV